MAKAETTGSFLLKELIPVSQNLGALGIAGLQALNYIDRGERASESWKSDQVAMTARTKTPRADVLLAVGPAVQTLVGASAAARKTGLKSTN